VGAKLFHVDEQTDMTKLIMCRNFAKAAKKPISLPAILYGYEKNEKSKLVNIM
jgi:hypothetical protein